MIITVCAAFLDVSKSFDSLDHVMLLKLYMGKLCSYKSLILNPLVVMLWL